MASFCAQCTADLFGSDFPSDFIGLSTFGDTMAGLYCLVLCEGCGPIQVDHLGRCISSDCAEHHNSDASQELQSR